MFENISTLMVMGILFISTLSLAIVPLMGTVFLWLASMLWRFKAKSFKTSLYVVLISFGSMIVVQGIVMFIFIDDISQRSSLIPLISLPIGLVVGIIATKKLFLESVIKSVGAIVTSFVFAIILFFIIILGFSAVSFSDIIYSLFSKPIQYNITEIKIIPFGSVFREDMEVLQSILKKEFPKIPTSISNKSIDLPLHAFDAKKQQYNAKLLLEAVSNLSENQQIRMIGVTEEDLFTPGLNFVFSTTQPRGNSMIMSFKKLRPVYDLENPNLRSERYQKIILRGLGITFGFKPSSDRSCVMAFSNSLAELDAKGSQWCGKEVELVQKIQGL